MSSIDKRIVEMVFNNSNFENGIKTSLNSLKNLDEKLKMNNSAKGLDGISKAASKVNLSGLSSGIETVTAKFSALGVMGATVLANITNSAVNAGKNLVKAFAIDPIIDGFGEYELKMNSIQTILTNTAKHGTKLSDVNKALNELNEYSDKTIYNFAQMTDNIGKATAAGVKLEDAVTFVKGMSNVAAGFGVDPTAMAGATYQMTQGLAAGKIMLQDWMSMERSGMGGEMLQDALIKTAESMGVTVDKTKAFRDTLKDGWLTSEIFIKTMKKMADDKSLLEAATNVTSFTKLLGTMKEQVGSGWAQTFEHIFGNKEQSTKLWTGISNSFGKMVSASAEARNKMFAEWNKGGGRDDVIKGLSNIVQSVGKGLGAVKDAFRDIFPPMTGKKLIEFSKGFKNLTEKFKMSDKTAGKIKSTFKGLFSIFSLGGKAVGALFKSLSPVGTLLGGFGKVLLNVTSGIGNFISKINEAAEKSNFFGKVSQGISKAFNSIGKLVTGAGKGITSLFSSISKIDFSKAFGAIGSFISGIGKGLSPIIQGLGNMISNIKLGDIFTGIGAALLGGGITKTVKKFGDIIDDTFGDVKSVFESFKDACGGITGILDSVRGALESYQKNLNASTLLKIAGAVGILAVSLALLSTLEPGQLATSLSGICGLFVALSAATAVLSKVLEDKKFKGVTKVTTSLLILSAAVLVLATAMKQLSSLNWEEIGKGLLSVASLIGLMIASSKLMSKESKGLLKTATSMIIFGAAIKILASSVSSLSSMDPNALVQGLVGLAAVMSEIVVFSNLMKEANSSIGNAASILVISGAIMVLAQAVKQFANLDANALAQGLVGIGALLTELALFAKYGNVGSNMLSTATGMLVLSAAILVLSHALNSIGSMSWEDLAKGLLGIAGALSIFGGIVKSMSDCLPGAAALLIISGALVVLSMAMKSLSSMSWDDLAKGILAMAGALSVLGLVATAMVECLPGAAAMLVMAGALAILVPQLLLLGSLSIEQVAVGLIALAGAFAIIGVAGLLLSPVAPAIIALSVAIGILGLACVGIGAGMLLFGMGLNLVGDAIAKVLPPATDFIKGFCEAIGGLAKDIGEAAESIANGISKIVEAVGELSKDLATAGVTLIGGLVDGIIKGVSAVGEAMKGVIDAIIKGVTNVGSKLVSAGKSLITGLIKGIQSMISAAGTAVKNVLNAAKNAVSGAASMLVSAGKSLITGFVNGIRGMISAVSGAIRNILNAAKNAASSAASTLVSAGRALINGLVNGVRGAIGLVSGAIRGAISAAKSAASGAASALVSAGRNLIHGLASGIRSGISAAKAAISSGISSVVSKAKAILQIHSPSRVFMEIGRYTVLGLAKGLTKYASVVDKPAEGLAQTVINSTNKALDAASKILNSDMDVNPVIAPVMDLSNVQSGANAINSLLSNRTMSIAGVSDGITKSIGRVQNGVSNGEIVSAIKDLKNELGNTNNTTYQINGITYDDGSNITNAVETLVRAAKMERRI